MSTAANVRSEESSHWYTSDGKPCYELPKKDGSGMKVPTLADARKLNLLPGVSTILRVLHKEALVVWRLEQAVLAVLTSPRIDIPQFDGEGREIGTRQETDDEFTKRVLSTERVQDQESQIARDRGTEIHDGLEMLCKNQPVSPELLPWISPAFDAIKNKGSFVATEMHIAGNGYGGRIDLLQQAPNSLWIWDWKTSKKLPEKGAYPEHRLQLAAYARAVEWMMFTKTGKTFTINTGNVYISTINQGEFVVCEHDEWKTTYDLGFAPLITHWQWANNYRPQPAA